MYRHRKLTSIIAIVFLCSIFFTNIAMANELDPFAKMGTVNSMESKTSIKMELNAKNLSKAEQEAMLQITPFLSNVNMNLTTKENRSQDKLKTEAYVNMGVNLMGTPISTEVWTKTDLSKGLPSIYEVIKVPNSLALLLPVEKEYLVLDSNSEALKDARANTNPIDVNKYTELTKRFTEITNTLLSEANNNFKFISDKGNTTVTTPEGNISAHSYEIKLSDAEFKTVLLFSLNNLLDSKDFASTLTDIIKLSDPAAENIDFSKEMPALKLGLKEFFNTIKDLQILGDKGIVIDYAVNSEGYIVSQSGTIDLVLDTQKLSALLDAPTADTDKSTGIYNLSVSFNTINYNINKAVKIDFPSLTSANSMGFDELLGSLAGDKGSSDKPKTKEPPKKETPKPATPAKKPVTPPSKVVAPPKKVTTPVKKVTTPVKKVTTPVKKVTTPAKKPVVKKPAAPVKKVTPPAKTTTKK